MADIVWRTSKLPDALIGAPYEASLAVTGNATAVTAASASPALPAGLSFSADFVRITGTPTRPGKGKWTGTITLTDTAGAVVSGTFTLVVRFHDDGDADGLSVATSKVGADYARMWS